MPRMYGDAIRATQRSKWLLYAPSQSQRRYMCATQHYLHRVLRPVRPTSGSRMHLTVPSTRVSHLLPRPVPVKTRRVKAHVSKHYFIRSWVSSFVLLLLMLYPNPPPRPIHQNRWTMTYEKGGGRSCPVPTFGRSVENTAFIYVRLPCPSITSAHYDTIVSLSCIDCTALLCAVRSTASMGSA
ncbi:hypothetical protein F5887DRAFT_170321 [Amanita rubescens]|nr:hypothetical protein F5887DRAFT_170321 [Amanita rubescens]